MHLNKLFKILLSVLTSPSLLGNPGAIQIPRVVHHELEVVVPINAHAHIVVVLNPLFNIDLAVTTARVVVLVVLLESVEELGQDIVFCFLSRLHVGVHLCVVDLTDVVHVEDAGLVFVHDCERLLGYVCAELIHFATDAAKELVVVDRAGTVTIEDGEETFCVLFLEADTEVVAGLHELGNVEVMAAIIVSDLELLSKTHNAAGTALS